MHTVQQLLNPYINQLKKFYSPVSLNSLQKLPPFKTYGESVKKICGISSKSTVYAHRKRLLDTGILLGYWSDEVEKCQYWQFNPLLLMLDATDLIERFVNKLLTSREQGINEPNSSLKINSKSSVFGISSSIFDSIITQNSSKEEVIVSPVNSVNNITYQERCASHEAVFTESRAENTGTSWGSGLRSEKNEAGSMNDLPGTMNTPCAAKTQAELANPRETKSELHLYLLKLTAAFWVQANELLYPGFEPDEEELHCIYQTIQNTYFNPKRQKMSEGQWFNYYLSLCERLKISKKTSTKNGNFIPPPQYYFSLPEQSKEFKFYKTKDFLGQIIYDQIRKELKKWQNGYGRHKDLSAIDLHLLHYKKICNTQSKLFIELYLTKLKNAYKKKI